MQTALVSWPKAACRLIVHNDALSTMLSMYTLRCTEKRQSPLPTPTVGWGGSSATLPSTQVHFMKDFRNNRILGVGEMEVKFV